VPRGTLKRVGAAIPRAVAQPWPEAENLTQAELARGQRNLDEMMRQLMFPPSDDGAPPEGGVREPRPPVSGPPSLTESKAEPKDG
jgi:hypothetical protein